MPNFTDLASVPSHPLAPFTDRLRLAVAAYLARFKGASRRCTESDVRCYLAWCAEHGLDPAFPLASDVALADQGVRTWPLVNRLVRLGGRNSSASSRQRHAPVL